MTPPVEEKCLGTYGFDANLSHENPQAAYKAVDDYVRSGMIIGLGTGSTAYFAGEGLGGGEGGR